MSLYESVFIARQDISTAQVEGLAETFEKIITDNAGTVKKTEQWGLRSLAYKIKKNRKGYYVLFNIDAPSAAVQEMERQMHIHEDILRFLTTRVDELEEGPSAVLRAKDRDDDRDRPRHGPRDFNKKPDFSKKPDAAAEKPSGDKAATPKTKTDDKAATPGTKTDDKAATPGTKTDDKAATPKTKTDDKAATPGTKTDDKAAAGEDKAAEKKSAATPDKEDTATDKEGEDK